MESLGNKLKSYRHNHFASHDLFIHSWAGMLMMFAFTVVLFFYWGSGPTWLLIVSGIGIVIPVATIVAEYHQLNNRPEVHVYDYGIAVSCTRLHAYGNGELEYIQAKWDDIKAVVHPEPDFVNQRMLGFYVVFSDGNKVLVPQSIEGYLELYSEFSRRGIKGANSPLPFYPMNYTGVMNSKNVTPYKVLEPLE